MDNDKLEAIQNVVDRVSSYQESAPEGTVEKELRAGLREADVEVDDGVVERLVGAIEGAPDDDAVRVSDVLA